MPKSPVHPQAVEAEETGTNSESETVVVTNFEEAIRGKALIYNVLYVIWKQII